MTSPIAGNNQDDFDVLRKRWLSRYLKIQGQTDTRIRTILLATAEDVDAQVSALQNNSTFSKGVRTAQLRLVMQTVQEALNELFNGIAPVIRDGQKKEALAAVDGLTETDRDYLAKVFANSGDVRDFLDSQKLQAQIQVANAINRVTKSDRPLSQRVYRTKALAKHWVKKEVTLGIARGASAKEIAKTVRKHIRPDTPGGVSYAAMRLGRTELNNAFHATAISLAQDRPWITGMSWHLSKRHEIDPLNVEICEEYSRRTFTMDSVPPKPHPQCRCFVAPIMEPIDVFTNNLTTGRYRDWIEHAA